MRIYPIVKRGGVVEWAPQGSDPGPARMSVASPSLDSVEAAFPTVSLEQLAALDQVALAPPDVSLSSAAALDQVGVSLAAGQAGTSLGGVTFTVGPLLAGKDTWVGISALCALDNANHNGEALVTNLNQTAMFAWDLSGLPAAATVTKAELTLRALTGPPVGGGGFLRYLASDAQELWDEATVRCDNRPTTDSQGGHTNVAPSYGQDATHNLVVLDVARVQARMGQGPVTFALASLEAVSTAWQSKDGPGDGALGPRLTITFTIP